MARLFSAAAALAVSLGLLLEWWRGRVDVFDWREIAIAVGTGVVLYFVAFPVIGFYLDRTRQIAQSFLGLVFVSGTSVGAFVFLAFTITAIGAAEVPFWPFAPAAAAIAAIGGAVIGGILWIGNPSRRR